MTELELKNRIKTGVDLYLDKTYDVKDLYNHMYSAIKDSTDGGTEHKKHLERFIFQIEGLIKDINQYFGGKKSRQVPIKQASEKLQQQIKWFLANGYSVDQYRGKAEENSLFK